jgi:hypothetical protein
MTHMSEGASKASRFQPNGWPTVIPRMFTPDVAGVVGFLKSTRMATCPQELLLS